MSELSTSLQQEPTRFIESSSDFGLRSDLELARASPVDYPVDAGLARFEASLASSTVPAGGTVAGFVVLRWFLGAAGILGVAALAWLLGSDPRPPEGDATVAAVSEARADQDEAAKPNPKLEAAPRVIAPAPALVAERAPEPPAPVVIQRPTKPGKPAPVVVDTKDPTLAEAELIAAARKALASDPKRTLELTEQAADQFPDGSMAQERRGYAILALLALDRESEARTAATAYLEQWPKGPLSPRIREGLGLLP